MCDGNSHSLCCHLPRRSFHVFCHFIGYLSFTEETQIFLNRFQEMPLYVLNGALGGALGGVFVLCWTLLQKKRQKMFSKMSVDTKSRIQLAGVCILSILTSLTFFSLSTSPCACKTIWNPPGDISSNDALCKPGEFNEMAYFLFGGRDAPIRAILSNPEQFDNQTLLSVGLSFLTLMVFTLGVALPTGIFMPTCLIGCTLGGFMGVKYKNWFTDEVSPSTFALYWGQRLFWLESKGRRSASVPS